MDQCVCHKCFKIFRYESNLLRHVSHSCKFNPNRTPRTDIKRPKGLTSDNDMNASNESNYNTIPIQSCKTSENHEAIPTVTRLGYDGETMHEVHRNQAIQKLVEDQVTKKLKEILPLNTIQKDFKEHDILNIGLSHPINLLMAERACAPLGPVHHNQPHINPMINQMGPIVYPQPETEGRSFQEIVEQRAQILAQEMIDKANQKATTKMQEDILQTVQTMQTMQQNILQKLDQNQKTLTNVFNIDKIQIYITDAIDFVEVLTKRFGNRKQAVDYIRSKVHKKVEGDVDVFCDIYLHGAPDTWPISCPDKKNHVFRIAQPNSQVINDPGGVQIYKMFRNIYSNTLLRLNNSAIYDTLNQVPGTPEYEASRDTLLDSFELGIIQDKAYELCRSPCDPFVKKLAVKFKSLEKSYELDVGAVEIS